MVSKRQIALLANFIKGCDERVEKTANGLMNQAKVTASSKKTVVAKLGSEAKGVQKVYGGLKAVLGTKAAYKASAKNKELASVLADLAIVATKIDMIKSIAEGEILEEEIPADVSAEDILGELTGDMGEEELPADGVETEGEEEDTEELPEEEEAVADEDLFGTEAEGEEDVEEEEVPATVPAVASKRSKASKQSKRIIAKQTVKPTVKASGSSIGLFTFIG